MIQQGKYVEHQVRWKSGQKKKIERCILLKLDDEVIISFNYVGIKDKEFNCPPFVLYIEN